MNISIRPVAFCLAVLFTSSLQPLAASAPTKAIRFGRLVDGGGHVIEKATVIVEKDRIVSVLAGDAALPTDAEVIDLTRYTGIPGLIDVHTHMTYYYDPASPGTPFEQSLSGRLPAVTVFLAQENARRTLDAGVTSVRDLGCRDDSDIAMRELINKGAMVGPRMFVSGPGMHISYGYPKPGTIATEVAIVDGVSQILAAVRANVLGKEVDVIKLYGSFGSADWLDDHQTYTFDEMKAAAEATHLLGRKLAIHAYGRDGARDAVRAGADSIEHPADLDEETIAEMVRRGTYYVPTVDHNRYYADNGTLFHYSPEVVASFRPFIERNLETLRRAHKAGVRIAMGSDALFTMFGQNTRELGWFVKAGMTPAQALATATTNAAALLGKEKELGGVAPGFYADLVAVEGDPLADINVVIDKVRWVMKGGAVVVDRTAPATAQ